jgi:hypothetical protein
MDDTQNSSTTFVRFDNVVVNLNCVSAVTIREDKIYVFLAGDREALVISDVDGKVCAWWKSKVTNVIG